MLLKDLKGLGPKRIEYLHAANIYSLRDLLYFFPYKYKDTSHISNIASVSPDTEYTFEVRFSDNIRSVYLKNINYCIANAYDNTGVLKCIWFNSPWIKSKINFNTNYIIHGFIRKFKNEYVLYNPTFESKKGIIPIYHKIKGINNTTLINLIIQAIEEYKFPEYISEELCKKFNLLSLKKAIFYRHFPKTHLSIQEANLRITYNDMLLYMNCLKLFKSENFVGISVDNNINFKKFWNALNLSPTNAQDRVIQEIITDIKSNFAMMRLVQGDVGSGKTAVAFAAMLYVSISKKYQSLFMAPTEVLAVQIYEQAKYLFAKFDLNVVLLTGNVKNKERQKVYKEIETNKANIIIGTHALFSVGIKYNNVGLIITDEQHRFGVSQRKSLETIASNKQTLPNILIMSATPIPRSLAQYMLSNISISVIDELPGGYKDIETFYIPEYKRNNMYKFIESLISSGGQAYIICKHIEQGDDEEIIALKSHYDNIIKSFPTNIKIGMLHGKMKSNEKDEAIKKFENNTYQILLSTTVVEVGVNVPNANVIVIENAKMYGLSQLHQLRGRIGRRGQKSYCFLMGKTSKKLDEFSKTLDGFKISEIDFKYRGPGSILGLSQHGRNYFSDMILDMIDNKDILNNLEYLLEQINKKTGDNEQFKKDTLELYNSLSACVTLT